MCNPPALRHKKTYVKSYGYAMSKQHALHHLTGYAKDYVTYACVRNT